MSPLRVPVDLRLHPPLPPGGYRVMKLMPTVIVATDMAKSKRVPRRRSANPISGRGAVSVVDSKFFSGEDNMESLMHDEFTAIYERDGDWHIAYCPEIPGANGQGRTKKEARESLSEAIALILEDPQEDGLRGVPPEVERETITVEIRGAA